MRKLLAGTAAVALAAGLTVAVVTSADAQITAPSNNSVLRGTVTVSDTGGVDNSSILGIKHCGGNVSTDIVLINSANQTVFSQHQSGSGTFTISLVTENFPNGAYTLRTLDNNGANSGFGGFGCTTQTTTNNESVTIDNIVSISYSGATSAPQNTNVTVSATLTDPNLSPSTLSGKTVTFALSGGASVNATTNASGVASTALAISGPPRTATLTVSFAATSFYDAKSVPITFDVTKDTTSTTLTQPAAVVHGQSTSFTATVAATQGSGTPTGSVQFTVDGSSFGAAVPLSGGVATTPSTSSLSTGSHTVGAVYSGDSNFLTSTSNTVAQVVAKAATTTTLASTPNPSVAGQGVTITATVSVVAPGAGAPSGGVQFDVDGQPFGTAVSLTGNTATLTISNLPTGNHDVTATYDGNADFAASNSNHVTQGVNKADTSVALQSSDNPSVSGQPVQFTATVSAVAPGAGTPTGQVQFAVDGNALGNPVDLTDGVATSAAISLPSGAHTVTADYLGDGSFSGQSTQLTQTVDQAATSTAISSNVNPSVFGQPVTFHAKVTADAPATGTPTGQVQFSVDGTPVGAPVTLVNGEADSDPVGDLSVGNHAVTVQYLGDAEFLTSASDALTQTVNRAPTTTSLHTSVNPSVFGQGVAFLTSVAAAPPGAGHPTGSISYTISGQTGTFTVPLDPVTGVPSSTVIDYVMSVGQHVITASYSGDGNFLPSSATYTQTVLRAQTATVVTSSANPAQTGQAISFTATVTPVAPGSGDPSGTVVFTVNGAQLGSPVNVVNGQATSSAFASLSPGTYTIAATYSGDRNFVGSSGGLDQGTGQNVTKGATSMTLAPDAASAAYGQTVTFTATVSAVAPATGTPSGVVQFSEGGVLLGSRSLVAGSGNSATAAFADSTLGPGPHSITASYVGNFNFTGQSAATSVSVGQVPTVTGVTSLANPSTFGDSVMFTAVVASVPSAASTPTGTVTFYEGSTVLGTGTLSTVQGQQQASVTVSGLHAGAHSITAVYGGDTADAGSTSSAYTQNVNRAASKVEAAILIRCDPSGCTGNGGRVRATLTGVGGAPLAGQALAFTTTQSTDHSVIHICTVVTDANGFASCDATALIPAIDNDGGYDVNFYGNADYLPSHDHGTQF